MSIERRFLRRELLIKAPVLVLLLASCTQSGPSSRTMEKVFTPTAEQERTFGKPDIRIADNQGFLIRMGNAYHIPNLARYLELTKAKDYFREPENMPSVASITNQYSLIQAPIEEGVFIAGDVKKAKKEGGERNKLYTGLSTTDQVARISSNDHIKPLNAFFDLMNDLERECKFDFKDTTSFLYGHDRLEDFFTAADTLRDPADNIQKAIADFEWEISNFPFAQTNIFVLALFLLFRLQWLILRR